MIRKLTQMCSRVCYRLANDVKTPLHLRRMYLLCGVGYSCLVVALDLDTAAQYLAKAATLLRNLPLI